jgi:heptosyltransferase-2
MNINSTDRSAFARDADRGADDTRPILIVPYVWIGDFVRGHTVVRVLKQRWPNRPIDVLTTSLCAPLLDYMPGVRAGIVWDLPRSRLALAQQWGLAQRLRAGNYGTALVMPRTWKSAIAPALAGIPERVGFVGEARFGLLNRWRWGEKALPRMIDKKAALALPEGAPLPPEWPVPQLHVPGEEIDRWRQANGLSASLAVALAPGSVGPSKRWTYYAEAARLPGSKSSVWTHRPNPAPALPRGCCRARWPAASGRFRRREREAAAPAIPAATAHRPAAPARRSCRSGGAGPFRSSANG